MSSEGRNLDEIGKIMGGYGIPAQEKEVGDIDKIEKDHLLNLLERNNLEQFLSEVSKYKNDEDFIKQAVKIDGLALQAADDRFRSDPEIVKIAVGSNGEALQYAEEKLKNDKDLVIRAIKHSSFGYALEYASSKLKADPEVVLIAALNGIDSIRFADKDVLADKDFMHSLIQIDGNALRYANDDMKNDSELVLLAISHQPQAFKYAGEKIRNEIMERLAALPVKKKKEKSEKKENNDILGINPIDMLQILTDKDKWYEYKNGSNNLYINRTVLLELIYWLDQVPKRLWFKVNGESGDQKIQLLKDINNLLQDLNKYKSNQKIRMDDVKYFKKTATELVEKISSSMHFDDNWYRRPGFWKMNHKNRS